MEKLYLCILAVYVIAIAEALCAVAVHDTILRSKDKSDQAKVGKLLKILKYSLLIATVLGITLVCLGGTFIWLILLIMPFVLSSIMNKI